MASRKAHRANRAASAVISSALVLCGFAACEGALAPSSEINPVADGSVSESGPLEDVSEPVADVSIPDRSDSDVDGGPCSTSADCDPGYFCVRWSDVYNASDNGVACLPLPVGCTTCGCAVEAASAYTKLGCYCFDTDSSVPELDASGTPIVVVGCSQA